MELNTHVDDGWEIAASEPARPRSRMDLIREALRILDGVEPDEIEVEGDGWSLVDPEAVGDRTTDVVPIHRPRADSGPLMSAIGDALDEAMSEGWLLADDEAA